MIGSSTNQPLVGRRAFAAGALAAVALAAAPGCTSADGGSGSAGAALEAEDEPLRIALRSPGCIDPYNCGTRSDVQVVWQLFDALTIYDFQAGELMGLAAESWEVSEDARTFTFHLVAGASFHNGEAVTATAFKRAWERIVNPASPVAALYGASDLGYLLALVEGYDELAAGEAKVLSGLSCPDDETFMVSLSEPYADFALVAAHPALGPVPYAASYDAAAFSLAPVGNGPFRLPDDFAWEEGRDIELERFDDYYGEPALVDSALLSIVADADEAYWDLQYGDADVAEVPIDELSGAKKSYGAAGDGCTMDDGEHLLIGVEPAVSYLACNTGRAPLSSAGVRRALSLALDRESICKNVYKRTRTAADGIVPPGVQGYREGAWAWCDHDADRAAELLAEELQTASDAAGSADEADADDGGQEAEYLVSLELDYYVDGGHDEAIECIVDDLVQVGVEAEPLALEWDELLERVGAGEFDLALLSWTPDFPSLDNVIYPLFHSDSVGGSNRSGYANAQVDELIDGARQTVDGDERLAALQEADAMVGDDMPVIPLMYYGHVLAGSERISSLYCDPMGRLELSTVELV